MGAVRTTCRVDNDPRIRNRFHQLGRLVERSFTDLITQISGKLINTSTNSGLYCSFHDRLRIRSLYF
ncbi:hypothetical protein L1887_03178 [Cichorium endivia]|nr:hypothetical protein L1887_03178 [Cichorium endivia]